MLRFSDLEREKGLDLTRTHIWRLQKEGKFPQPIRVTGGRAVYWIESEIDAYIEGMIAARDAKG
jgi:predicted DNA-binding transcriptional regulator AlpA